MNKLIQYINNKTNEKYSYLRFKNAIFSADKNNLTVNLNYRENIKLDDADKQEIINIIKEYLNDKVKINVKFFKNYLDKTSLIKNLKQILIDEFPSLAVMINLEKLSCEFNNEKFIINFYVYSNFANVENIKIMIKNMIDNLTDKFCYGFEYKITEDGFFNYNEVLVEQEDIEDVDGNKIVAKNYVTVFPEPYTDVKQMDFFVQEDVITNEDLLNNTYVVFDLETTGLNYLNDKIVEIGAVKIIDGKIKEQFSTLINPLMHIPDEATKINGITDKMVSDAPTFNKVVADFYKFCDKSILVAHNATFDMTFIKNMSTKLKYNFNHQQKDTLFLAREKLPGLKNYRLATICERLGVSLNNAHRSMGDTVATAKIFIKLMQNN